jgi:hypothetical protein
MRTESHEATPPFSSNLVRLSIREWLVVLLVLVLLGAISGPLWNRVESSSWAADYRIPYGSSEDYWLFGRFCTEAVGSGKTLVVGDSFVWGQYAGRSETLSSFLNQETGSTGFVNAGLDGSHPLALEGLMKHYCGELRNGQVILHLNLLWMSSLQADLQLEGGPQFNHPRLVPQFAPTIPSYRASTSDRLGVLVARHLPVLDWNRHLRFTYFENRDLPRWTLDHPYENPLHKLVSTEIPSDDLPHPNPQAWDVEGGSLQDPPWVNLDSSLQWQAFQRLVRDLQARGNDLFILVGPLNEHMLTVPSQERYRSTLQQAEDWLVRESIPFLTAPLLPSHLYADLSHPLGQGYALLADGLINAFRVATDGD